MALEFFEIKAKNLLSTVSKRDIFYAIERNKTDKIELLKRYIAADGDVNAVVNGQSILMVAASNNNNQHVVRLLTEHSQIQSDATDYLGRTACDHAIQLGLLEVVKFLPITQRGFLLAAKDGYTEIVNRYIEAGGDVTVTQRSRKKTALMLAVVNNDTETVTRLVEHKATELHATDEEGETAYDLAVQRQRHNTAKLLPLSKKGFLAVAEEKNVTDEVNRSIAIDKDPRILLWVVEVDNKRLLYHLVNVHKMSLAARDDEGKDAVLTAALAGLREMVNLLVDVHNMRLDVYDNQGRDPLLLAILSGNQLLVDTLISKHSMRLTVCDQEGNDPLMLAAKAGHTTLVKHLIENYHQNIDVYAINLAGHTAYKIAQQQEHPETTEVLKEYHQDRESFLSAAQTGNLLGLDDLISKNEAIIKARDNEGNNALMLAAKGGHEKLVIHLVENYQQDIHATNKSGQTPRELAQQQGHQKVAEVLEKYDQGKDAFVLVAALSGDQSRLDDLIYKHNMNIEARDKEGNNALMLAAQRGHKTLVKHLIENHQQDIHVTNKFGQTACELARKGEHRETTALLEKYEQEAIQDHSAIEEDEKHHAVNDAIGPTKGGLNLPKSPAAMNTQAQVRRKLRSAQPSGDSKDDEIIAGKSDKSTQTTITTGQSFFPIVNVTATNSGQDTVGKLNGSCFLR